MARRSGCMASLVIGALSLAGGISSASAQGLWEGPYSLPLPGIHAILLPASGNVLLFSYPLSGGGSDAYVFNPTTLGLTQYPTSEDIFCGGQHLTKDGRVLVNGGSSAGVGETKALYFDEATGFVPAPTMNTARWYPSIVRLANGNLLTLSGLDENGNLNDAVEILKPLTGWRRLRRADLFLDLYPMAFLAPSTQVVVVGPQPATVALDVATRTWTYVASSSSYHFSGCALPLPPYPGRYLVSGGIDALGADLSLCEVLDLNDLTPAWRTVGAMKRKRFHHNTVLLPDGTVLATGGARYGSGGNEVGVLPSELFDPATEVWTLMASMARARLYHSTAILLRDGRVLTCGGDGEFSAEIYSPDYLFRGARPTLTSVPPSAGYGQPITVGSDQAGDITGAVLMAPGAVTHSHNTAQLYVELGFVQSSATTLDVTMPATKAVAQPGWYLLFLLNSSGVPSVGEFLRLQ